MNRSVLSVARKYPVDIDQLRKLITVDRLSRTVAASILGIPKHAVNAHCQIHGIHGKPNRTGLTARVKNLPVDEIRILLEAGDLSIETIATKYLVSSEAIRNVRDALGIEANRTGPK